jgi:predicted TIM-barrel fold metal-dependent hydrolase
VIIDSHAHVMLPVEKQIESMDEAGIDRTILFSTLVHPELATDLVTFDKELNVLGDILSGKINASEARKKAIEEQVHAINKYPTRFIGFGSVPIGLSKENTAIWIEEQILRNNFRGIGEFTLAPGQVSQLETVFSVVKEIRTLPIWVHTFSPLNLNDIQVLARLAQQYPDIPVIFGHLGGINWLETIKIAKEIPNIYLDLSALFTTFALSIALNELPERTLFSSDAPYGDPLIAKRAIERATEDQYVREQVLGGTISKLLYL